MSDPVWLPDVLRAEGLQCDIFPGAFERGHGDFGGIWGVVCHHTGSFGETPNGIANHPTLGLASQLYLSPQGVYTLCGVGVAWHAGQGSWPGIQTDNANQVTIGIEPANDGGGAPGKPHRWGWPDVQYDAYVRGVAAILRHLGKPASHAIGHKEWAGAAQGKWDPGAIDMNIFRSDVQRVIDNQGAEDMANVPQEQWDAVYQELTKRFPSRSKYYRAAVKAQGGDPDKVIDTLAGFTLNSEGKLNDAAVERNALMGAKDAIALVKLLADSGDAESQLVYSKCPKAS